MLKPFSRTCLGSHLDIRVFPEFERIGNLTQDKLQDDQKTNEC